MCIRNDRGIMTIILVLAMVALCMIVGLAVDIGYMHMTKGQLQNAADAAALAGAAKLDDTTYSYTQSAARLAAFSLASSNRAAGKSCKLAFNETTNDKNGDIVVGNWDGTSFTASTGSTLINAVKVVTRRTDEKADGIISGENGPVDIFFAKVMGWSQMQTRAEAIATMPMRGNMPITICRDAVENPPGFPATFYFNESDIPTDSLGNKMEKLGLGITEFKSTFDTSFNKDELKQFTDWMEGASFPPDLCRQSIASNNAAPATFIGNPAKTGIVGAEFDKLASVTPSGSVWVAIVPVLDKSDTDPGCPPGTSSSDPRRLWGYAKVQITEVIPNPNPGLKINKIISYSPCTNPWGASGLKATLAK